MKITIKDPIVVKELLSEEEFKRVQSEVDYFHKNAPLTLWNSERGRFQTSENLMLDEIHYNLIKVAQEKFGRSTIRATHYIVSVYEGQLANLHVHKDDGACQYAIDLCVSERVPWSVWVSGKEYMLEENDALFFYGNDQYHFRKEFPEPDTNIVSVVTFFFCEQDHWFFTEGPEYRDVIRGRITKDEWEAGKDKDV